MYSLGNFAEGFPMIRRIPRKLLIRGLSFEPRW